MKQMLRFLKPVTNRVPVVQSSFFSRSLLVVSGIVGVGLGGYYLTDARSGIHEYLLCPLIRNLTDAEQGHKLGIKFMKYGLAPTLKDEDLHPEYDEVLGVNVFGTRLSTPIGLAAGLDKDGEAIEALFNCGFSYVEIGSITPEPQPGNPQPRFFRLPRDDAVINRYGFNSTGHFNVIANLKLRFNKLYQKFTKENSNEYPSSMAFRPGKLLGINLGKNKTGDEVSDYVKGVQRLGPYADVLIINVSSPNTPGLRDLQNEAKLTNLLTVVKNERDSLKTNLINKQIPILVKIAPDLSEPEIISISSSAKTAGIDGIIVSNTTVQRPLDDLKTTDTNLINQTGGLSGKPLKPISLQALRTLRKHTKDSNLVLIGCGGISSGKDALEFGKAGATFVQLYTAFAYKGPGLPAKIRDELFQELTKENKTWEQIIGQDDP